jgi:SAM-dependent methyltransferase
MGLEKIHSKKNDDYFGQVRDDIISLVPATAKRVLDVGCGTGATGAKLKQLNGIAEVAGIEFVPKAAQIAIQRLDRVLVGDVEAIPLDFPESYFDCIVCADILEHCKDPWELLKKLRSYLSHNGVLIASIPNLRHLVVVLKIIFDRWEYEQEGILDEGHLRFFTFHTIKNMFRKTGFEILSVKTNQSVSWKFKLLNLCSFGLLKPFSIYQYLIIAKKKN